MRPRSATRLSIPAFSRAALGVARRGSALAALALFVYARARAAPAPGTPIDNVANATGTVAFGTVSATSNTVRTLVGALESATLVRGQSVTAAAGSPIALVHRLTNTGNAAASFRLDLANLAGDGFDLAALALHRDANLDGTLDPGDPAIAPGSAIALAAGDSAGLIVSATVPLAAPNGTEAWITITASGTASAFTVSNADTVHATAALVPPALAFYTDGSYSATTRVSSVFRPLYVEAAAPQCDLDPSRPDTVTITIASVRTGDVESYLAAETGPATGRFRAVPFVPTFDVTPALLATHAGIVDLARNDEIVATLDGCGAVRTEARVWIDPAGVVFDARGGQTIGGATVRLVDVTGGGNGGVAGGAARVYLADGVTPAPSVITTAADGLYDFPLVAGSTYRLEIQPPATWRFPSGITPVNLPAGHVIDPAGSYGSDFDVTGTLAPVRWDVPLDAVPQVALFAEKTASRSVVEVGDQLDYTVRVESRSDSALAAVALTDALPRGFTYVAGTARRDSALLADPAGGAGPSLTFDLGAFGAREAANVRYRVRVGPGALDGDGVNRAYASSAGVRSNEASARVQLTGGVFAEEATLIGTVWVDLDGDRRRGAGEPGMPGVRLYLDDGTFAVTDPAGNYSLYGLNPRSSAIKLDGVSLPDGVRPASSDRRDFGTPGVRLVDLQRGELQRADFALVPDSSRFGADTAAVAMARRRAARPGMFGNEVTRGLARETSVEGVAMLPGDPRARPTSGIVSGESRLPLYGEAARPETRRESAPPSAANAVASWAPPAPVVASGAAAGAEAALAATLPLEQLATSLDSDLGFIGLSDLDTLAVDQVTVRVKGQIGVPLQLRVNGQVIPESRVGRRVTAHQTGVEAWEYVGIELKPGVNLLEVSPPRSVGRIALRLVAPGPLARIELLPPRASIADGHTAAPLRVRAVDQDGIGVGARTLVTLETTLGQFAGTDLDPVTPGFQTAIEGGEAALAVVSPASPGRARIAATSGPLHTAATIDFVPDLRPLFAVGSVEGVVAFGRTHRGPTAAEHPVTGFESQAEQFRSERVDGRGLATARGAMFVKGRLLEELLLTFGYDTDKPEGLRRFRDIQPESFYPVYGDASVRGYEAQSTGRLYARLDRRGASLMYGDFITPTSGARSLAAYNRSFSGALEHFESERLRLDGFTSRERARRRVEELPGQGISGPYQLPGAPILENSERVEIVTRDRNQSSVVLNAAPRARFTDYEIDPLAGRIVFKQPVPSFDGELNPVSVRVSYEVESGGDAFWVSGVNGRVLLTPRLEAGASMVDDHDPDRPSELRSLSLAARFAPRTVLETEWASSRELGGQRGDAARFELRHESPAVQARAFASSTGQDFDNPGAGYGSGRTEAGGRMQARLDEKTQLRMEALYSEDVATRDRRGGLLMSFTRVLSRELQGELGARVAGEERPTGFEDPTSYTLRGRLAAQWPGRPDLTGYAEAEQCVIDPRRLVALGAEYRIGTRGRLYARHELASTLTSPYALSENQRRLASVVGIDANVASDAHVFSEYRLGSSLPGREAEAALGLRNVWTVDGGMRIGASFERVSPLLGANTGPVTAITGSIEYADGEDWKGSSRWEVRTGRASDTYLSSLAAAARLSPAWTVLGRQYVTLSDEHASGSHTRERLQAGFAYRDNRREAWDALMRYELRYDRDVPRAGYAHRRIANVVSAHGTGRVGDAVLASLAWAGKRVSERGDGLMTGSGAQWVMGRATWDVGRDWDAGMTGSTLLGRGFGSRRYGLGAELGRQLGNGMWLSAGWNRFGYEDQDLTGDEYTREGAYLRLRARFDDGMFRLPAGAKR